MGRAGKHQEVESILNITQDTLMKQIADRENVNPAMVRRLFRSAEDIIFDYLSSTAPPEEINIKLLNGIQIRRRYIKEKKYSRGMFQNRDCPEHVHTKASLSKYYNGQVNRKLFEQETDKQNGLPQTAAKQEEHNGQHNFY